MALTQTSTLRIITTVAIIINHNGKVDEIKVGKINPISIK